MRRASARVEPGSRAVFPEVHVLTAEQKMQVKRHLGYHSVSQSFYPLIDGFASIDTILSDLSATPETEAEVVVLLGRLAAIEDQIDAVVKRVGVEKAGAIGLTPDGGGAELWRALGRWRRELSILIGIPQRVPPGGVVVVV
jgi:hypothetical protein